MHSPARQDRFLPTHVVSILCGLALWGCGPRGASPPAHTAQTETRAPATQTEVDINGGSIVIQQGQYTLEPGQDLHIFYSPSNGACPPSAGDQTGAAFRVDDSQATPLSLSPSTNGYLDTHVPVPAGHALSFWFWRQDAQGHVTCWDSLGGRNYVFAIGEVPRIDVSGGVATGPTSPLVAGRPVLIHYDESHSVCPPLEEDYYGGGFNVDGDHGTPLPLVQRAGESAEAATVLVPPGHTFSFWFFRNGPSGDVNCWDSRGGQNYDFQINPGP